MLPTLGQSGQSESMNANRLGPIIMSENAPRCLFGIGRQTDQHVGNNLEWIFQVIVVVRVEIQLDRSMMPPEYLVCQMMAKLVPERSRYSNRMLRCIHAYQWSPQ